MRVCKVESVGKAFQQEGTEQERSGTAWWFGGAAKGFAGAGPRGRGGGEGVVAGVPCQVGKDQLLVSGRSLTL